VGASLRNLSFLNNNNFICISDCAQSVCNHNDGLVSRLYENIQSSLNLVLTLSIKGYIFVSKR
jgi:hypothetical protein